MDFTIAPNPFINLAALARRIRDDGLEPVALERDHDGRLQAPHVNVVLFARGGILGAIEVLREVLRRRIREKLRERARHDDHRLREHDRHHA